MREIVSKGCTLMPKGEVGEGTIVIQISGHGVPNLFLGLKTPGKTKGKMLAGSSAE